MLNQPAGSQMQTMRGGPRATAQPLTDPVQIERLRRHWQLKVMLASMAGYALFYFVRKNLSIAMPAMAKDLHLEKDDLGLFLTLHGLLYGVSKFANGIVGDRANARTFMVTGLILSAVVNIFFGFSSAAIALGIWWMVNGWVQGMGFPPCARLMTHWFSPKELATKMSIWNTSHSIGAGIVVIVCGYLAAVNWRLCFLAPALLVIVCALFLWRVLPDTPESVGLPETKGTEAAGAGSSAGKAQAGSFGELLMAYVFANPYVWIVSLANFFVYTVRYAVLDWGPTLLHEAKGYELQKAGWMVASFEISGIAGMLVSGWVTDHIFGGRGSRTCLFYMAMCTAIIYFLWTTPSGSGATITLLLCAAGFFIYGPQCLVGIIAANLATKRAAATAVGLTGIFGYASTVLSGWGLGKLVKLHGWDAGFKAMLIMAAVGLVLFALAWPAKAHGYNESEPGT